MKKITLSIFVMGTAAPSTATIINIPADYPTIQQGIDASADGDTVLVQPGTYVENIDFNGHNIVLGSLFLTTGDTSYIAQTVIDGDNNGSVITLASGEDSSAVISGFTITGGLALEGGGIHCEDSDPKIIGNAIEDNLGDAGGGIFCSNSDAVMARNVIRENSLISPAGNPGGGICCREGSVCRIIYNVIYNNINQDGGAIAVAESSPLIRNNLMFNNTALDLGGAIRSDYSLPIIINNTIALNSATAGGGIYLISSSGSLIINNLLWDDSAATSNEIHAISGSISISYCNIQDTLWPGEGNIDIDPLFRDPDNGDFHLMAIACGDSADSPCIDAGNPYISDSLLDCSHGLGAPNSDMGVYGGGDSVTVGIGDNSSYDPDEFKLLQNCPNPFNEGTKITFSIVNSIDVKLTVYDLLGREVYTLIDNFKRAGVHSVTFDAAHLSSGIYFYRLQAGEECRTKPMLLLK